MSIRAIINVAVCLTVVASAAASQYQVVSVSETKVYAGRLGNTVTRTVTAQSNGKVVKVTLPSFHDLFKPLPKAPAVGDMITVRD